MRRLVLGITCVLALGCEFNSSSTPPQPAQQPQAKPTPSRASKPGVQTPAKPAPPAKRPDNVVERGGLRFTYDPKLGRQGQGHSVSVSIRVEAIDGKTHVIYGLGKGIAFGGIRFGKQGGGSPLREMGKVQAFGRVAPGRPLVIGRDFPGQPAPGGGWSPLVAGDNLILSVRTWHSIGGEKVANPTELEIGAVTVTVDDGGRAETGVQQPK